jgi:hypothetical protein
VEGNADDRLITTAEAAATGLEYVTAALAIETSASGGSGSFLIRADDSERYWCKSLNNGQSPRVPATEQIVGRLATLIGAHVCEPRLVWIPTALAGWEFRPGRYLEEGWAHGSRAVQAAVETHRLAHRGEDSNEQRQAGFFAIYDWLLGGDPQWLYSTAEDNAYYQHDSGHYFPGAPDWTRDGLRNAIDQANPLQQATDGLDSAELLRLADALDALTRQEISDVLANMDTIWPIDSADIEAVIDVADGRRREVAARVRTL